MISEYRLTTLIESDLQLWDWPVSQESQYPPGQLTTGHWQDK